jgi:hypothetical protein
MSDEQQAPPPAAPTNSAEASAVLAARVADTAWSDKLLLRDADTTREFNELTAMVADGGSDVDVALSGGALPDLPDSGLRMMSNTAAMLHEIGIEPGPIRQLLEGYEISKAEHDAVTALKGQLMRSAEFTKRYLEGEPEAVKRMTLCNIVLSSTIKTEKAA